MATPANIRCPSCHGALVPTALHCTTCDLTVTGDFASNEFASLGEDDLHFLRIFIHCEGRIRDMESALGVSYPTIKNRLAKLKETLAATSDVPPPIPFPNPALSRAKADILELLEGGKLTFEQAMEELKRIRAGDET